MFAEFAQSIWQHIQNCLHTKPLPPHLKRGLLGERAAKHYLQKQGLKFLTANFKTRRGEIDLIFRDPNNHTLAFVEVKTRSRADWTRPAAAVTPRKRRRLTLAALAYLRRLRARPPRFRFDIVEVLLQDDKIREIRHLPNAFPIQQRNYFPDGSPD
jgi:putative endonuclease